MLLCSRSLLWGLTFVRPQSSLEGDHTPFPTPNPKYKEVELIFLAWVCGWVCAWCVFLKILNSPGAVGYASGLCQLQFADPGPISARPESLKYLSILMSLICLYHPYFSFNVSQLTCTFLHDSEIFNFVREPLSHDLAQSGGTDSDR